MKHVLLDRQTFKERIFTRDRRACVICKQPGVDAHHIVERKLWTDGGYYEANGALLCSAHHLDAEMTSLSAEDIRTAAGIRVVLLPPCLKEGVDYDKWGNEILPGGTRIAGPLFNDDGVQKILRRAGLLKLFVSPEEDT